MLCLHTEVPCYGTQTCPPKEGNGRRAWQSKVLRLPRLARSDIITTRAERRRGLPLSFRRYDYPPDTCLLHKGDLNGER